MGTSTIRTTIPIINAIKYFFSAGDDDTDAIPKKAAESVVLFQDSPSSTPVTLGVPPFISE